MNWTRAFSFEEYLFLGIFLLIYLIYIIRLNIVSKSLKVSFNAFILKFVLRATYLGLITLSILGPSFGITDIEAMQQSKDIFMAVDLSNSMNATDIEPSRLEKAKSEIDVLIDNFEFDQLGLSVFNSESQVLAPLTYDHSRVKSILTTLNTNILPSGSTNYSAPLALINNKLEKSFHKKVGLIITDGENHMPWDKATLQALKKNKVSVVWLILGTPNGGNIPQGSGFKKNKEGQIISTKPDLKSIAELSNNIDSRYFVINDIQNQINDLSAYISKLEFTEDQKANAITYNKYLYFLIPALILVFVDVLINVTIFKI